MEMNKRWKRIFSGLMVLVLMISCLYMQPLEVSAATGKITLEKTKTTLYVEESTTIKVKKVTNLKNAKVTFSSSNKKIATVSSKGVVTAKKKALLR